MKKKEIIGKIYAKKDNSKKLLCLNLHIECKNKAIADYIKHLALGLFNITNWSKVVWSESKTLTMENEPNTGTRKHNE